MQAYDFSWQDATMNALKSFESQPSMYVNPQPRLPITMPQSAYDPTFSSTSFFGYGFNDPSPVNPDIPAAYGSGRSATGHYENAGHDRQGQRSSWGEYDLNQGFSSQANNRVGYAGPPVYQDQDVNFQVTRLPCRLPIVPIYDNIYTGATAASDSMLQADLLQSSNPNLYPHNAMPLTIKHPEFSQQGQQSSPSDEAWAEHLMSNVMRLEQHTGNAHASKQPPLTVSQSQSHAQSQPQSQPQSYTPQQPQQLTMEQIHAILSQAHEIQAPVDVTQLYQQTANLHDNIAAYRLNSGAKEIATLPSAIPSVPPLHSRTPAPIQRFTQNHPYTSPRFAPHASPRLGVGGVTAGSLRSVRPSVPRIKRESLWIPAPTTTASLARLRRQIPVSELASERTPVDPYHGSAGLAYPLSLAPGSANGSMGMGMGNAMPGSGSTSTSSLPPESPFARTHSTLPNLAMPEARSRPGSVSPKKEYPQLYSPFGAGPNDGGFLRFYHGTTNGNGNAQERPGTGTTVASSSTAVSYGQAAERLQSPPINATDRLQSQTRATAARKRADDDILQHSFRDDGDWRRRIVLEAVLASPFVAENTLEPLSTGTGAGDALLVGVGSEDMGMGLGSPGKSVYAVFLEQVEKSEWRCLFGDRDHPCASQAVAFRRLERALDHVRSHLNHRPFGCKGESMLASLHAAICKIMSSGRKVLAVRCVGRLSGSRTCLATGWRINLIVSYTQYAILAILAIDHITINQLTLHGSSLTTILFDVFPWSHQWIICIFQLASHLVLYLSQGLFSIRACSASRRNPYYPITNFTNFTNNPRINICLFMVSCQFSLALARGRALGRIIRTSILC